MLEARPGRIERIIDVPVPHPRERSNPQLRALVEEVRDAIIEPSRRVN